MEIRSQLWTMILGSASHYNDRLLLCFFFNIYALVAALFLKHVPFCPISCLSHTH